MTPKPTMFAPAPRAAMTLSGIWSVFAVIAIVVTTDTVTGNCRPDNPIPWKCLQELNAFGFTIDEQDPDFRENLARAMVLSTRNARGIGIASMRK